MSWDHAAPLSSVWESADCVGEDCCYSSASSQLRDSESDLTQYSIIINSVRTTSTMSGYKPRRPAPPPPNMPSHSQLKTYFDRSVVHIIAHWQYYYFRVDSNKSGSITPGELQAALVNGNNTEFNSVTINMMISKIRLLLNCLKMILFEGLFDHDKTGEITFDEFGSLWRYVIDWQNCFKTFDK